VANAIIAPASTTLRKKKSRRNRLFHPVIPIMARVQCASSWLSTTRCLFWKLRLSSSVLRRPTRKRFGRCNSPPNRSLIPLAARQPAPKRRAASLESTGKSLNEFASFDCSTISGTALSRLALLQQGYATFLIACLRCSALIFRRLTVGLETIPSFLFLTLIRNKSQEFPACVRHFGTGHEPVSH
jgi:hypothetical protein